MMAAGVAKIGRTLAAFFTIIVIFSNNNVQHSRTEHLRLL
jgi:hypothetical protein